MAACQKFVARFLHLFETLVVSTDSLEGWEHARTWLFELLTTKPATFKFVLFTRFTLMIGFGLTLDTEIFAASVTSNTIFSHMHSSLPRNRLTLLILLFHIYLSWRHFHNVSALALNEIR